MIKSILVFLTTFAFIYLGIAFTLNFNPREWHEIFRAIFVFAELCFPSLFVFIHNDITK